MGFYFSIASFLIQLPFNIMKEQNLKALKIANLTVSILIFVVNVYFLPMSIEIIISTGGSFGFGWVLFPYSLSVNLLLLSARQTFKPKNKNTIGLLVFNGIGLIWSLYLLWCSLWGYCLEK